MRTAKALSNWLLADDAAHFELRPDIDNLDALAPDREALWARLDGASFLTQDEKRAAAGYGPLAAVAAKFNPHHDEAGRFTFAPDGGGDPAGVPVIPVAGRPRGFGPPKPPPAGVPVKPATPRSDFGATSKGRPFTEHGQKRNEERNFTSDRIDAIIDNNSKTRVGKVDSNGQKTWEYADTRGNTVVTSENGSIITTFSNGPGSKYIEKPSGGNR